MTHRIGVDIGGTFTDFALIDDRTGTIATHKQLTTPDDPSVAVIDGLQTMLRENGVAMTAVTRIIHGTTLVTNAVIERKGARIGMLVTGGFGDVLDIGKERRYDLFDLRLEFPPPLVPRDMRVEVSERLRFDGEVLVPIDDAQVEAALDTLIGERGAEAIAVCLMHSYVNPAHEERVRRILARRHPKTYASISSEGFPVIREFERWTTTTMNAYVQPMVDRYLARIEEGLRSIGYLGTLLIMSSSGGTLTPDTARRFPVRLLESGPAAGALMSAYSGRAIGVEQLLSFDMGGTTAKGALVLGGAPLKRYELEAARVHEFKKGSGLTVKIPVLDMIEIGAGGGSIASVDERGVVRVGPRSAGASPGPACYGLGGEQATLTDANLMLGYLDPKFFLGGRMAIDREASGRVVRARIGEPLGLAELRAAWGIHETINEDVARAFRVHASERGVDYRGCSMVAFGGSGPLHAVRIAQKLKIPRVVMPPGAGVMSALGMLVSPLSFEVIRFRRMRVDALDAAGFAGQFALLQREASAVLEQAGVAPADISVACTLDMRYVGQGYEIEVPLPRDLPPGQAFSQLAQRYGDVYERLFAIRFADRPIEIVNWKVEAVGPEPAAARQVRVGGFEARAAAIKGERAAYFPESGAPVDCPVYDRYAMPAGTRLVGPALIEERESTIVIGVGVRAHVDALLNVVAEP